MTGKILIAHACPETAAEMKRQLARAGCEIALTDKLTAISRLLHQRPDLLLFDIGLAQNADPQRLHGLAADLVLAETFCVRLAAADAEFSTIQQLTPFACATISPPDIAEQSLELLNVLLKIKQAEEERDLAQGRLALYRMEVEAGLHSAAQIQHALLPGRAPQTPAFSFAWRFIPCETVGGDLFNMLSLAEDTLLVYILDVSGHGVSSAMVTVSVYQSLCDRTSQLIKHPLDQPPFYRIAQPAEVLQDLDREYPFERFDKFFTIAYLLLEPETGRVRYCNAGHPAPILIRADGRVELLETGGPLVGLGGLVPFEEGEVELRPGDRLHLYSDGISESAAPSGEMYGTQRLIDYFQHHRQTPLEEATADFITELQNFSDHAPPADDISLFSIQFNAPVRTPRRPGREMAGHQNN